jgi:hypothetical protein
VCKPKADNFNICLIVQFLFWSFAERQVYRSNLNKIQEVMGAVEGKV